MARLVLIRGLPGSGKTTMAKQMVVEDSDMIHVETDQYFEDADGNYKFVPYELSFAHNWCINRTRALLEQGYSVVVSNTFTRLWEMKSYFDLVEEYDTELAVITATGNYNSVHDVPEHTIENMRKRWEEL